MKHTVVLAGLGARGKIHLRGILENPDRFELVGIFDPSPEVLKSVSAQFKVNCIFSSAEEMMSKTRPEVLVFVTHPQIRMEYIDLGIKYGVKGIAFEKPMSVSLTEARELTKKCVDHKIKAIISHQHKYFKQMQQMHACVKSGVLGPTELIRISMLPWASHLATHYIDYALWANGGIGAEWVVGHVSGRNKLFDNHPSPDYMMGEARLKNGATLFIEGGYLAPKLLPDDRFWLNDRLTVYGPHGYAWAEADGRCAFFHPGTNGRVESYQYENFHIQAEFYAQTPYYAKFADWLDDDRNKHSCNIEISLHGFEIMEGIFKSALLNTKVDLPIQGEILDSIEQMKKMLPEEKYPAGFEQSMFFKCGIKA